MKKGKGTKKIDLTDTAVEGLHRLKRRGNMAYKK
jgi:hypothetical protein